MVFSIGDTMRKTSSAAPKKLFHVQMVLEAAALHQVMSAADGHAFDVKVSAVKMAGDEPATSLNRGSTSRMVEEWIAQFKGDTFNVGDDVIPAIRAGGGAVSSVYTAITAMMKRGDLVRVATGTYRIKDRQKLLPAPAKATDDQKPHKRRQPAHGGQTNRDVIVAAISSGPKTSAQLSALFRQKKRNPKSVSPVLAQLKAERAIAITDGHYRLQTGG